MNKKIYILYLVTLIFFLSFTFKIIADSEDIIVVEKYAKQYLKTGSNIISYSKIYDFNEGEYILAEFKPAGYLIIEKNYDILLEGSIDSNSPYYEFNTYKKMYLGLGEYYILNNDYFYDINRDVELNYNDYYEILHRNSINMENVLLSYYQNNSNSLEYVSDYRYISQHIYFARLTEYYENVNGDCGIVALCMMLGYFNTFINGQTIPVDDDISDSTNLFNKYPDITRVGNVNNTELYQDYDKMPGTGKKLHYVLKEYGHTFNAAYVSYNIDGHDFRMNSINLQNTFNDYKNEYIPGDYSNNYSSYRITTNISDTIKTNIDSDIPSIAILISYTYNQNGNEIDGNNHIVVAYGYNGNNFICNLGWGNLNTTSSIVSDVWFLSGFYITYDGPHVHNANIKWEYIESQYICYGSYCPCGKLLNMYGHNFFESQNEYYCEYCGYICNDHDLIYYSFNRGGHKYRCEICGLINQSSHILRRSNQMYYCTKCPYMSSNGMGTYD